MTGSPLRVFVFILLVVGTLGVLLSGAPTSKAQAQQLEAPATVTRVVDGDTVEISPAIGGKTDVRLIGVDTPETVDPSTPVQPYGPEASRFTKRELEGQRVTLEFDEDREDDLGRLLAYVRVGGAGAATFNETLLRQGYAQLWVIAPNDKYEARFRQAQQQARTAERGIWGLTKQQQCQLANHDNGIGEGSPGCDSTAPQPPNPQEPDPPQPSPESPEEGSKGQGPKQRPTKAERANPILPETGGLPLLPLAALATGLGIMGAKIARRG